MKIILSSPHEEIIVPEQKKTITELTIQRMVDLPNEKIVRVFIEELIEPVILWSGDDYDEIGQWTDADVEARLVELFS